MVRHGIRPRRTRGIVVAVIAAALAVLGVPAVAAAACAKSSTTQAFAQFGDEASYTLAPGGSFETGASGWKLSHASVVEGNDPFELAPGTHSLAVAPGGSAASPLVCMSGEYPTFRFVARDVGGSPDDRLVVTVRVINLLGISVNTSFAPLEGSSSWSPTPALQFGNALPLWVPGTSLQVGLVFTASGTGTWTIDDVYIDPYSR
jgi:hypothetical protein